MPFQTPLNSKQRDHFTDLLMTGRCFQCKHKQMTQLTLGGLVIYIPDWRIAN